MTHYDTLGISKDATDEGIKQAYRKLALKYHPDRNKSEDAAEKFKSISEAFETLADPHKKFVYDQRLPSKVEEDIRKEAREFFKDVKEVEKEVHTPVVNAQPPLFDLWGKRLTPEEQQQWLDDLHSDPRKLKPQKPRKTDGFYDVYANSYEPQDGTHLR